MIFFLKETNVDIVWECDIKKKNTICCCSPVRTTLKIQFFNCRRVCATFVKFHGFTSEKIGIFDKLMRRCWIQEFILFAYLILSRYSLRQCTLGKPTFKLPKLLQSWTNQLSYSLQRSQQSPMRKRRPENERERERERERKKDWKENEITSRLTAPGRTLSSQPSTLYHTDRDPDHAIAKESWSWRAGESSPENYTLPPKRGRAAHELKNHRSQIVDAVSLVNRFGRAERSRRIFNGRWWTGQLD